MSRNRSAPLPQPAIDHFIELRNGPGTSRVRFQRMAGWRDLLREVGWPLSRIAEGLNVSRQAVEQWGNGKAIREGHPTPCLPPPPEPKPEPAKRVKLTVPEDTAAVMRELVPLAAAVNGRTPVDSPLRQAGDELARLMAEQVRRGVSIQKVADAAGQTRNAVAFRLARYGYDDCIPDWTIDYVERVSAS